MRALHFQVPWLWKIPWVWGHRSLQHFLSNSMVVLGLCKGGECGLVVSGTKIITAGLVIACVFDPTLKWNEETSPSKHLSGLS